MALRTRAGTALAFTACARELAAGRLAQPVRAIRAPGTPRASLTEVCPVHDADRCLQRYLSAPWVAGWSLWTFLTWRKSRRPGGDR